MSDGRLRQITQPSKLGFPESKGRSRSPSSPASPPEHAGRHDDLVQQGRTRLAVQREITGSRTGCALGPEVMLRAAAATATLASYKQ